MIYDALFLRKGCARHQFLCLSCSFVSAPLGSTAYLPPAPGLMFGDDGPACVAPWLVGHFRFRNYGKLPRFAMTFFGEERHPPKI